jgi:hypothetical protein
MASTIRPNTSTGIQRLDPIPAAVWLGAGWVIGSVLVLSGLFIIPVTVPGGHFCRINGEPSMTSYCYPLPDRTYRVFSSPQQIGSPWYQSITAPTGVVVLSAASVALLGYGAYCILTRKTRTSVIWRTAPLAGSLILVVGFEMVFVSQDMLQFLAIDLLLAGVLLATVTTAALWVYARVTRPEEARFNVRRAAREFL